jgi:hypothetical protein
MRCSDCPAHRPGRYDDAHIYAVIHLTALLERASRGLLMTTQPIGPRSAVSSAHWSAPSPACNRAYFLAAVRAGLIALALLTMLVAIALF